MSNERDQNDTDERERLLRRIRYGPVSIEDHTCTECALREAIAVAGSKSGVVPDAESYVPVRSDTAESGLWVIGGKRQVIYAKAALSVLDRYRAARRITEC
jgi:hypothetical protein